MIKKESKNVGRVRRHTRIRKKIHGTAECPRLSVFRSNSHIYAQIIDDAKGVTLVSCSSFNLKLENGSNVEAASKVGAELAKLAVAKTQERLNKLSDSVTSANSSIASFEKYEALANKKSILHTKS